MALDHHAAFERMIVGFTRAVKSLPASKRRSVLDQWRRSFEVLGAKEGLSQKEIRGWARRIDATIAS